MGVFEQFPYTNFHDLNLDWILKKLKDFEKDLTDFVAQNAIKYANPIDWNIEKQYEKNTVTVDPETGVAYLSIKPVPNGISIKNTDFWSPIFDYNKYPIYNGQEETTTFRGHYNIIEPTEGQAHIYDPLTETLKIIDSKGEN